MKDFQYRNDTKLLFRNDPTDELKHLAEGKRVLFVYGGGSVKENGCYDDVVSAAGADCAAFFELSGASRERETIEAGIELATQNQIDLVIGAGGANVMDCAKLIAFGTRHQDELWDHVKGEKDPYGADRLELILMPTYPSSGSEYGLGAVAADSRTGDFGTAYGIAADIALLVPKYSLSLDAEMTAYTALVTLVQLSASTIGDRNPVSYDIGISVIRRVRRAAETLREHPDDLDARGAVMLGASIATSGRLGLGKVENYPYEIYEVEFIPEALFGVPYRKSLTTLFPRFLAVVGEHHEEDIVRYFRDAFDSHGSVQDSAAKMVALFEELGLDMHFDGSVSPEEILDVKTQTALLPEDVVRIIESCMRENA